MSDNRVSGFSPSGWISGTVDNTLQQKGSISVLPPLPAGTIILGLTVLPIHLYSNDPHPEPFPGLQTNFTTDGRGFILSAEPYNPRDSIQFFMWQVTYGTAPAGYQPRGWKSGVTSNASLPQKINTQISPNEAIAGVTVLPIHIYSNDPNPEPWPGLIAEFTESGSIFLSSDGTKPRDSIDWFLWQTFLGRQGASPTRIGWNSGVTGSADLPARINPTIPPGFGIVSVTVLPIHIYKNDPKPEPWPGLRVDFPTPQSFTIQAVANDPRDSIDWFEWQVTYAALG